jgi:hypothetical protein
MEADLMNLFDMSNRVPPKAPFSVAMETLLSAGKRVAPSDIPGLVWVDGRELTMGQVVDFARQIVR